MTDRFDLEQQILECWKITDEIPMMESQGANVSDMTSLACVYEFKFKQLWATFEAMIAEGNLSNNLIGAEIHSDKDYQVGTKEECEKFAETRRKKRMNEYEKL